MGHSFVDRCNRLNSPVHRLDARVKVLAALSFVALLVTIQPQHLLSFVIFGGALVWIVAFSQVPLGRLFLRAAMVLPFSAFVALGLPFLKGGEVVNVLGFNLSVNGLWMFWSVAVKSMLGTAAIVLLVSTTPFGKVLDGMRRLGVPAFLIDILALTYRYILLLADETVRLRQAALARGYAPRWLPQAVIVGWLIGNLFLRSYERAERVYGAMRLRGFQGDMPMERHAIAWRPVEAVGLVVFVALLVGVRVLGS